MEITMDENKEFDFENEEELENTVTLLDEDGNEHEFEHVDSFSLNGETYVFLIPSECADEEEIDEVLIFSLAEDEDGNETLELVEDEAELDMAFEEFKQRMQEDFEFEE